MGHIEEFRVMNLHQWSFTKLAVKARHFCCNFNNLHLCSLNQRLIIPNKAANNFVVVCRLHYVNTLKQELDGTRAYLETDTDEISVVNAHLNDLPV